MCFETPNLPEEANRAKNVAIACFVVSLFSVVGFFAGWPGVVGAICGILALVASSVLMCCATADGGGGGRFGAAAALLLVAGVVQVAMAVAGFVLLANNGGDEGDYCADRYVACATDSNGTECADAYGADALCARPETCTGATCTFDGTTACAPRSAYDLCTSLHGGDAEGSLSETLLVVLGVSSAYLLVAGVLNAAAGVVCVKAAMRLSEYV